MMPAVPVVRCASHIPASQITQRLALIPRTVHRILPPRRLDLALYPRQEKPCGVPGDRHHRSAVTHQVSSNSLALKKLYKDSRHCGSTSQYE